MLIVGIRDLMHIDWQSALMCIVWQSSLLRINWQSTLVCIAWQSTPVLFQCWFTNFFNVHWCTFTIFTPMCYEGKRTSVFDQEVHRKKKKKKLHLLNFFSYMMYSLKPSLSMVEVLVENFFAKVFQFWNTKNFYKNLHYKVFSLYCKTTQTISFTYKKRTWGRDKKTIGSNSKGILVSP